MTRNASKVRIRPKSNKKFENERFQKMRSFVDTIRKQVLNTVMKVYDVMPIFYFNLTEFPRISSLNMNVRARFIRNFTNHSSPNFLTDALQTTEACRHRISPNCCESKNHSHITRLLHRRYQKSASVSKKNCP